MADFDVRADKIQLPLLARRDIDLVGSGRNPVPIALEPPVPYRSTPADAFQADQPYDFVCLTRSPPYSPPTADPLFDAIRDAFIAES